MGGGGKGGAQGPSKKTVEKEKKKIIEDKTFGLKNKNKSAKVQKYVANVEKTVQQQGKKKPDKKAEAAPKAEELFTPVAIVQKKLEPGVDPKSVLCEYFKAGQCVRGTKCKYSHDVAVERRAEKIDLYTDQREIDSMENWDQDELERVVSQRHGQSQRTEIVCKFFLDAIEKKKYGWFWECPNGGSTCPYRHALPPGFVLVSKKVEVEEVEVLPIEEQIEEERKKLKTHTPLTLELFLEWKERKRKAAEEKRIEDERKRKTEINSGRAMMSGREMFVFNPELFVDDEGAMEVDELTDRDELDASIPHHIVTATATSLSLKPVHASDNNSPMVVQVDGVPVQWLLFVDDEGLPEISDDEEEETNDMDQDDNQDDQ